MAWTSVEEISPRSRLGARRVTSIMEAGFSTSSMSEGMLRVSRGTLRIFSENIFSSGIKVSQRIKARTKARSFNAQFLVKRWMMNLIIVLDTQAGTL
jgi:hypothetical protein